MQNGSSGASATDGGDQVPPIFPRYRCLLTFGRCHTYSRCGHFLKSRPAALLASFLAACLEAETAVYDEAWSCLVYIENSGPIAFAVLVFAYPRTNLAQSRGRSFELSNICKVESRPAPSAGFAPRTCVYFR